MQYSNQKKTASEDNFNNSKEELIAIEAEIQKWEALREQIADANIEAENILPISGEDEVVNSTLVEKFISDVKSGNLDNPQIEEIAQHLSGVYAEIVRDKKRSKEQQKKAEEIINLLQVLKTQTLKETQKEISVRNPQNIEKLEVARLLTSNLQNSTNIDLQNVVALRQNQIRDVTLAPQNNILQQQLTQLNTVTNQLATNLKAADIFLRQASQNAAISEVVSLNQAVRQNVTNATALNASRVEINNIIASQQQQTQTQVIAEQRTQQPQQPQMSVERLQQIQERVASQVQQIAQNATKILEQVKVSSPEIKSNIQEIAKQTTQIAERAKQLEVVQKISEVTKVGKGGYAEVKQTPEMQKNTISIKEPVVQTSVAAKIAEVVKPNSVKAEIPQQKVESKLAEKPPEIKAETKLEAKTEVKPEVVRLEKIEPKENIKSLDKQEEKPSGKVGACGGCTGSSCGVCFVSQWRAGVASGQFKPPADIVATQAAVVTQQVAQVR